LAEILLGQFRGPGYAPGMDPLFEVTFDRIRTTPRAASKTLYREFRKAILEGRVRPGTRLPPTRRGVEFFGVSRNTTVEVYERLACEGFVVARRGSGTFVADPIPEPATAPARDDQPPHPGRVNPFWLRTEIQSAIGFWRDPPNLQSVAGVGIDFRPGLIDARLFPHDVFRQSMAGQLRRLERRPASLEGAQGNQGNAYLRAAIADHIALTRAVPCHPDDILVTSGAQQAFDLLARVLVRPGETVVALEDPGYPPMRAAFAAAGATLVPVAIDDGGLRLDQLPARVDVICVCPSHQFPLGISMSPERREALLEVARARGAVIVEDDYDGEFRYEGSPLEALRSHAAADVVFYVGTFSKCMLPSLRLGFVVAPSWALRSLIAAKNCCDWYCSIPVQLGVASFIAEGQLARHVRKMRRVYGERRQALTEALQRTLGEWVTPLPSWYGMHLTATGDEAVDFDAVAEAAESCGVKVHTLSRYHFGAPQRAGLVFGYGAVDVAQAREGVRVLHGILTRRGARKSASRPGCSRATLLRG
jgi:GntR family transcriptional regulator/MocR family aminotransferase